MTIFVVVIFIVIIIIVYSPRRGRPPSGRRVQSARAHAGRGHARARAGSESQGEVRWRGEYRGLTCNWRGGIKFESGTLDGVSRTECVCSVESNHELNEVSKPE